LPASFTCEAGQSTIAGWLEPANTVGGNTFDYALEQDALHISITDAAGHDVAARSSDMIVGVPQGILQRYSPDPSSLRWPGSYILPARVLGESS
jgi:serine phosphatase RsbU (regulator of sigma subunit)